MDLTASHVNPVTIKIKRSITDVQHIESDVWPDSHCSDVFAMIFNVVNNAGQFYDEQVYIQLYIGHVIMRVLLYTSLYYYTLASVQDVITVLRLLYFKMNGFDHFKLQVVHLYPAIEAEFPDSIKEYWLHRLRHWPPSHLVTKITSMPCQLVPQPTTEQQPLKVSFLYKSNFSCSS